ncbi:MAG TPA: hypothetical protein VNV43_00165 [Candidatus Acidoferrales bacterium]|nr:hypothetical protein [Candidatus Acidoferrales bacterium]
MNSGLFGSFDKLFEQGTEGGRIPRDRITLNARRSARQSACTINRRRNWTAAVRRRRRKGRRVSQFLSGASLAFALRINCLIGCFSFR